MKNHLLAALLLSTLFMVSCSDEPEAGDNDKVETKDITRNGAIETLLTTTHLDDSRDILTTTHKVWKDGALINTIMHTDTLPALGVDSNIKAADEKGEATTATGKKDYEFYITVK
jgi:PBP1b-binding outer membrane lipoprotein LpoB